MTLVRFAREWIMKTALGRLCGDIGGVIAPYGHAAEIQTSRQTLSWSAYPRYESCNTIVGTSMRPHAGDVLSSLVCPGRRRVAQLQRAPGA